MRASSQLTLTVARRSPSGVSCPRRDPDTRSCAATASADIGQGQDDQLITLRARHGRAPPALTWPPSYRVNFTPVASVSWVRLFLASYWPRVSVSTVCAALYA